ncbi:MAG: proline--tRNA ligase [Armatimonadota bacterium]
MHIGDFYAPTLRDAPSDAQIPSDRLLRRGGFLRPLAAGVFNFLPLGLRVLQKVEAILREEMNAAGAVELLMPVLQPRELWDRSGRWEDFEPPLMSFQDRNERWFALGPTHEECITALVQEDVTSYRQLPVTLYQIQAKFRDEVRPRGGIIRGKEFVMKDAYSFDVDREGLDRSYDAMYEAYLRFFERVGLEVEVVHAEAGAMGGYGTREFMVLAQNGEDTVFKCDSCEYASNAECASYNPPEPTAVPDKLGEPAEVSTPGATTIEQVCEYLDTEPQHLVKTLIYRTDSGFVAALVRGDRELNETKLAATLETTELCMATAAEIQEITDAQVGFSGPVGLPEDVTIVADHEIAAMNDFVTGANETDAHIVGVDAGVDFEVDQYDDIRNVVTGDECPECDGGLLEAYRAIEVGHIFKLGTKYSEALGALIQTEDGDQVSMVMGCYGIGVSRIIASIVEVSHDDNGVIWPRAVAPFEAALLLLDPDDENLAAIAEDLHDALEDRGISVLLDDRDERAGVKFNDAELIGYPLRVVVGRVTRENNEVELQVRADGRELTVNVKEAADVITDILAEVP